MIFVHISFRTVFYIIFVLGLVVLMVLSPWAKADERHTRSWYVSHPEIMRQVLATCRDDPGGIGMSRDCQNARAGEIYQTSLLAQRQAGIPVLRAPTDPQFWLDHPAWLREEIRQCDHKIVDAFCPAARSAAAQGGAGR